jgi:hypothetical protein
VKPQEPLDLLFDVVPITNMLNPTAKTILINNIKTSITYGFSVTIFYSKISVLKIEPHIELVKPSGGYDSNASNRSNYGKNVVEPFSSVRFLKHCLKQ